jgi:hypothetical protein
MIVEWSFPMHVHKTLGHLQQTRLLNPAMRNLTLPEAENLFAPQRGSATSIATLNSNPDW